MSIVLDGSNLTTTGVINSGTAVASTSGTSIDFTGIPAGTKRITVMFNGVSTSGAAYVIIQLGYSGGVETSGYLGAVAQMPNSSTPAALNFTTGFIIDGASNSAAVRTGVATIALLNSSTNLWTAMGCIGRTDTTISSSFGGAKALTGTLDRVRITTSNGTDTFDAGSINILYE